MHEGQKTPSSDTSAIFDNTRFGFKKSNKLQLKGVPPEVFFVLAIDGEEPEGDVEFHNGFKADGEHIA